MKNLTARLCAAALALACLSAHANGIKGSLVTSTLSVTPTIATSNFSSDPGEALTIGPGSEYDATTNAVTGGKGANAFSYTDSYSANFNGNNSILKIDETCSAVAGTNPCRHDTDPFSMTFSDSAFTGDVLTLLSGGANYMYVLVGDEIIINYLGGSTPGEIKLSISAAAPEPSSIALLGTGLLAIAFFARRRLAV